MAHRQPARSSARRGQGRRPPGSARDKAITIPTAGGAEDEEDEDDEEEPAGEMLEAVAPDAGPSDRAPEEEQPVAATPPREPTPPPPTPPPPEPEPEAPREASPPMEEAEKQSEEPESNEPASQPEPAAHAEPEPPKPAAAEAALPRVAPTPPASRPTSAARPVSARRLVPKPAPPEAPPAAKDTQDDESGKKEGGKDGMAAPPAQETQEVPAAQAEEKEEEEARKEATPPPPPSPVPPPQEPPPVAEADPFDDELAGMSSGGPRLAPMEHVDLAPSPEPAEPASSSAQASGADDGKQPEAASDPAPEPTPAQAAPPRPDEDEDEDAHAKDEDAAAPSGMDPNFFYDSATVRWAGPSAVRMPGNVLELRDALGYACEKPSNLVAVDTNVIAFANGALVQLEDLALGTRKYVRTLSGGGVGSLATHPAFTHLAGAENGTNPDIVVYSLPDLRIARLLRKGALNGYAHISFNASGTKLASVAVAPDYMLTVWDWANENPILRIKAFSSDVWRVSFSPVNDGQLTTSGAGHIRFWKMANTFTGLKLQGEIGKFGRTEISDISGYVELPDGKVLSGSEWGNLLLWEGGLIKCEIARKGRKLCHAGAVDFVAYDEGEIITAGADGHVRIWDADQVDAADRPSDTDTVAELEPMSERKVGHGSRISHMTKARVRPRAGAGDDEKDEPALWYVQDAAGHIWDLDLAHPTRAPSKLFTFHAGAITGVAACPRSHLAATAGMDGHVRVHDYYTGRQVLATWTAGTAATALVWGSAALDPAARTLVAGFADGMLRVLQLSRERGREDAQGKEARDRLVLKAVVKPHAAALVAIHPAPSGSNVVTVGADNTIFFATMSASQLYEPIGFFAAPAKVTCVTWRGPTGPVLVGLASGAVLEVQVPTAGSVDVRQTFRLDSLQVRTFLFKSVAHLLQTPQPPPATAGGTEPKPSAAASGTAAAAAAPAETAAPAEPAAPPAITGAWYRDTDASTFLVSVSSTGAGYIYECSFEMELPLRATRIASGRTAAPVAIVPTPDRQHVVLGMEDGWVRVHSTSDLEQSFGLSLHDHPVRHMALAFDSSHLITAATDGTLFLLRASLPGAAAASAGTPLDLASDPGKLCEDITDPKFYSLEEAKQKSELDKKLKTAEEKKADERRLIQQLRARFAELLAANAALPADQQLPRSAFEMDPQMASRLAERTAAAKSQLQAELAWELERHRIAREKLEQHYTRLVDAPLFIVKSILSTAEVATFRLVRQSKVFRRHSQMLFDSPPGQELLTLTSRKLRLGATSSLQQLSEDASEPHADSEAAASRMAAEQQQQGEQQQGQAASPVGEDLAATLRSQRAFNATAGSIDLSLSRRQSKLDEERQRHEEKTKQKEQRQQEWKALMSSKPDETSVDPHDQQLIRNVQQDMGDFKLKTSADYVVPLSERVNTTRKRNQLLALRQRIMDAKALFNAEVAQLRASKTSALANIAALRHRLEQVLRELGQPAPPLPSLPSLDAAEEPDRKREFTRETLLVFKEEHARQLERERAEKQAASGFGGGFGKQPNKASEDAAAGPAESASAAQTLIQALRDISAP